MNQSSCVYVGVCVFLCASSNKSSVNSMNAILVMQLKSFVSSIRQGVTSRWEEEKKKRRVTTIISFYVFVRAGVHVLALDYAIVCECALETRP